MGRTSSPEAEDFLCIVGGWVVGKLIKTVECLDEEFTCGRKVIRQLGNILKLMAKNLLQLYLRR